MAKGIDIRGYRLEVYQDEDGSWVAEVPDLPGCVAASAKFGDLPKVADDAIEAWIEAAVADGRTVPQPTGIDEDYSGRFVLRLTRSLHRRLAHQARREGVSLNTYCSNVLSEATGVADLRRQLVDAQWSRPVAAATGHPTFQVAEGRIGRWVRFDMSREIFATATQGQVRSFGADDVSPYALAKYAESKR